MIVEKVQFLWTGFAEIVLLNGTAIAKMRIYVGAFHCYIQITIG
jgi:hypothetical protein